MKALRYSFSHFWSIHGWTSEDHEAIASHFAEVVNQFGPYHLLYNNCRHFLYVSLRSLPPVLALPSDIVLLNPNPLMTLFSGLQSAMTLWRHVQRDLYRWIWKCMWGPGGCGACLDWPCMLKIPRTDWESRPLFASSHSGLLEDLCYEHHWSSHIVDQIIRKLEKARKNEWPPRISTVGCGSVCVDQVGAVQTWTDLACWKCLDQTGLGQCEWGSEESLPTWDSESPFWCYLMLYLSDTQVSADEDRHYGKQFSISIGWLTIKGLLTSCLENIVHWKCVRLW